MENELISCKTELIQLSNGLDLKLPISNITQANSVTETGKYALDAKENNSVIAGTLANKIAALDALRYACNVINVEWDPYYVTQQYSTLCFYPLINMGFWYVDIYMQNLNGTVIIGRVTNFIPYGWSTLNGNGVAWDRQNPIWITLKGTDNGVIIEVDAFGKDLSDRVMNFRGFGWLNGYMT